MSASHRSKKRALTITGLCGNEIFCLNKAGYKPGSLVVGNSVQSLGFIGSLSSDMRNLAGGESIDITRVIKAGRDAALQRMQQESLQEGASGVTGVSSELTSFNGQIEFLSTGSAVKATGQAEGNGEVFSTSFDGKELFCLVDAGYKPKQFVFGNIAYSLGLGGGLMGSIRSLGRGEIPEYSDILNKTRQASLERLVDEAYEHGANAVLGVEVDMMPFGGFHEMLMTGTAAVHPLLPQGQVASCDLTCDEMWSLANMGYAPVKIVMGTAVYSLGFVGGIVAAFKGLKRGEISELTSLVYEAREHALDQLEKQARQAGADFVAGTDVYIHELGNGLLEFMAIGTAMRAVPGMTTKTEVLPVQAAVPHRRTFRNSWDSLLSGSDQTE